jgi:succinoglycan biosynthesis transport protein ExoP
VGEIAEAMRKANEAVDGSKTKAEAVPRHNEETSGEITAALSRASAKPDGHLPTEATETAAAAPNSDLPPKPEPPEESQVIPGNLGRAIFHVERHRHMGLRIRNELDRTGNRSIAIVSANRNEGKSTVSCNLAAAIASVSNERSVALVDLDLRNPSLAGLLNIPIRIGIEQVLQGRAKLTEVCVPLREPQIDVYPCAHPHRAAHELWVLPSFQSLLKELEARYTAVIIDTPPTLLVQDSTLIVRHTSYAIAVARAGKSRVNRFTEMLDRLPSDKIMGKVLNNVPIPSHERDDDYYYATEELP